MSAVMDAPVTETPSADVLKMEAETLPAKANRLAIVDQASYALVVETGKGAKALETTIKEHYGPLKEAAHATHKKICDAEKSVLKPVQEALAMLRKKIGDWDTEQKRKQREEEERLAAEARAREEEERLRAAAEAEAEGASAEVVDQILETPAPVVVPKAAPVYEAASGVSTRKLYKAKVVNIKAFCRAVADGVIPETYVTPNMTALNGRATSDKEGFNIPGCELVIETSVALKS